MQAFNGAALFAATHLTLEGLTQPIWGRLDAEDTRRPKRLVKSKSPLKVNKWRYIFETGRTVLEKSGIDLDRLNEAMDISESGGTHKGKLTASEDAADKVVSLRGGSGRPDSHFDGLPQNVINNPKYEQSLKLREWSSRNKSTDKSSDDLHEPCSYQDTPKQSPSKYDTFDNLLGTDDNWVGSVWSEEVLSKHDTNLPNKSPDHAISVPPPSLPDPVDVLDEKCFEQQVKQWSIPTSVVPYGMSDVWQANIQQASRPAIHELHRQRHIYNALNQGKMKEPQARYLLSRTHGLKCESTRKFTLPIFDLRAAEVLGKASKALPGREKDAETARASVRNVESNRASPRSETAVSSQRNQAGQHLDGDAWLASILHLGQFS